MVASRTARRHITTVPVGVWNHPDHLPVCQKTVTYQTALAHTNRSNHSCRRSSRPREERDSTGLVWPSRALLFENGLLQSYQQYDNIYNHEHKTFLPLPDVARDRGCHPATVARIAAMKASNESRAGLGFQHVEAAALKKIIRDTAGQPPKKRGNQGNSGLAELFPLFFWNCCPGVLQAREQYVQYKQ